MRKTASVLLAVLASTALFVIIFFTSIEWVAFDEGRYAAAQEKYQVAQTMGVSKADLGKIMHELLLYCRGGRSDLNMQVPFSGQTREVFDEREKAHMVDVQRLFVSGYNLRVWLIVAFLVLLLLLVPIARKKALRELARGWVVTVCVLGALLVALGVYFALDFDRAWTQFHLLFFSNDLWQLYYNEALIQMLLPLFDGLVQAIVITAAAALLVVTALAITALRLTRPRGLKASPDAN